LATGATELLDPADDIRDADGVDVLNFNQAQATARAWFASEARRAAGVEEASTDGTFTVATDIAERLIAARSEMPVTIPGSAIGRMISSVIASRPKKRARNSAAAARVPRIIASAVEASATRTDRSRAFQMSWRSQATANH